VRLGSGYTGSPTQQTSVANAEIIPTPPTEQDIKYSFYKFSFMNSGEDCTIQVNNGSPIFLKANQGFSIDAIDSPIHSFKILEDGIQYNWVAAY